MPEELLNLDVVQQDGVTVVTLGPQFETLDEARLAGLRDVLLQVADRADPPLLVIDLANTKFFASAFIEVLFRTWNRLNTRPGSAMCLSSLTPHCAEVIECTHLDRLWKIAPNRDEAVKALRPGGA